MKYGKLHATVKGFTCEGKPFTEELDFQLIPPANGECYYGTGCYMRIKMSLGRPQLEDVRYAKTTDIEILADRFIQGWYGPNARDVWMEFPPSKDG